MNILVKEGANVTERNTFNDGSTIAIIMNTDNYYFEFDITENEISKMSKGNSLQLKIKALNNRTISAKIDDLGLTYENGNYQYFARAILGDTISNLWPEFTGLAKFDIANKENILSIKEKNILYNNEKTYVEIINEENSIIQKMIRTGISDGIYTEIIDGLKLNQKVKVQ